MKITFSGGLNENDGTLPEECQSGVNFDLVQGSKNFRPRRPFDIKGITPLSSSVSGILQLIKKDNTETTLIFDANIATPTINKWDGIVFTSVRVNSLSSLSELRDAYWPLDEYIVITDLNKKTANLKWDGLTCSRLKNGLASGNIVSITGITRTGTTAIATYSAAHGKSDGDLVHIFGANEAQYNGEFEVSVLNATQVIYPVVSAPATPATGTITADSGVNFFSKYSVEHQGRMWFFNITTDLDENSHMIAASAFENPLSMDTTLRSKDSGFLTGNEAFFMLTPDLKSINGATVFMDKLIISTEKGQLFELSGFDSKTYQWDEFYQGSAATGTESIQNIGNDVIFMREGGNIELLSATRNFGDVRGDDISRWIPDTVQDLSESQIIYDKTLQKVLFFVQDKCLVLFKDKLSAGSESPWSIYETELPFNLNINAAKYMRRPSENSWSVYIGDSSGNIYDLNGAGFGDSGNTNIKTNRKTQLIDFSAEEGLNTITEMLLGRVQYRRVGECEITFDFDWSNEYNISSVSFNLDGAPPGSQGNFFGGNNYFGGDNYFNQGSSFIDKVGSKNFSPTGKGESFFMNISLDTSVRFKVDNVRLEA